MNRIDFKWDGPKRTTREARDFRAECKSAGIEPLSTVQAATLLEDWQGVKKGALVLVTTRADGGAVYVLDDAGEVREVIVSTIEPSNDGPIIITIEGGGFPVERHTLTPDLAMSLAWTLDELRRRGADEEEPVAVYEGDLAKLLAAQLERDELAKRLADVEVERDAMAAQLVKPTDAPNDA